MSERIREYARAKGLHPRTVNRWLRWNEPDKNALLTIAISLKIGENHLRDFMDWLEEIALRDGIGIRTVLENGSINEALANPRLGRADKIKRIKEQVRRLRFPRLSRTEDAIHARIRDLKLRSEIRLFVPPGLEGGAVKVEFTAGSQEEFKQLVRRLAEAGDRESMREIFSLLKGESVASSP